jgi:phosphoribosylglycinamide formyltransferase 1
MKLVVLISGRGSNLEALLGSIERGVLSASIVAVISNREDAKGLELARVRSIPTVVLSHKQFESREAFDEVLVQKIQQFEPDLIILAGFMRILSSYFVEAFFPRILNIHPSLLPAFKGLHTHERALQEGVKLHGCTVHIVTPELDTGQILGQGVVPVFSNDTPDTLAVRVLNVEHQLFSAVIQAIVSGAWRYKPLERLMPTELFHWEYVAEPCHVKLEEGASFYIA